MSKFFPLANVALALALFLGLIGKIHCLRHCLLRLLLLRLRLRLLLLRLRFRLIKRLEVD